MAPLYVAGMLLILPILEVDEVGYNSFTGGGAPHPSRTIAEGRVWRSGARLWAGGCGVSGGRSGPPEGGGRLGWGGESWIPSLIPFVPGPSICPGGSRVFDHPCALCLRRLRWGVQEPGPDGILFASDAKEGRSEKARGGRRPSSSSSCSSLDTAPARAEGAGEGAEDAVPQVCQARLRQRRRREQQRGRRGHPGGSLAEKGRWGNNGAGDPPVFRR